MHWQRLLHHYRHLLLFMLAALLLGIASVMVFFYLPLREDMAQLQKRNQQLEQNREALLQRVAASEVENEVLKSSKLALREALDAQQAELAEKEKSLDFFRQLMVTDSDNAGLALNGLTLAATPEPQTFFYRLTFVQYAKKHRRMNASLSVAVHGSQQGEKTTYALADLLTENSAWPGKLGFKYFQVLEGRLRLPQGFEPETIDIEAIPADKRDQPLKRTIDWQIKEQ